jgi:hypothetical protein
MEATTTLETKGKLFFADKAVPFKCYLQSNCCCAEKMISSYGIMPFLHLQELSRRI